MKISSFSYWGGSFIFFFTFIFLGGGSFKTWRHHLIDLSITLWSQLSKLSELMKRKCNHFLNILPLSV